MSDIDKILKIHGKLNDSLDPVSKALKQLEGNSSIQQLFQEADRNQNLIRAALGSFEELERSGAFDQLSRNIDVALQARDAFAQIQDNFDLPEIQEAANIFQSFRHNDAFEIMERYHIQEQAIQRAIESMSTPWLDIQNQIQSIKGFAELQGIGHALQTVPAFDTQLNEALRVDLGDWQTEITWPSDIFTDATERAAFYLDRGLDPALTSFPAEAFNESLIRAGIKETPAPLIRAYNRNSKEEGDEEADFERTNAAHDRLQRFETQLRQFIDTRMKEAFGENWIKHKIPGDMRSDWQDKKQKAMDNGEAAWPLIAYADFTDYVKIIIKKDNWENVFKDFFQRKTAVEESFQRLYPIRICTMHSRMITQDDELYLYVETKRIFNAIGITL